LAAPVNGFNGYLYSPGDVSGLANALKPITDVEVCKVLAHRLVRHYSSTPLLKRYENLFTEFGIAST
jgi:hypothetical protein